MGPRRAEFDDIGITGYPESHHLISDEETIQAMFAKAPMATLIVSQVCFDAAVIEGWIRAVRTRGTDLPIWIGLPGCVARARLLRVSMKMGLGESTRFLRHNRGWASRLLARRYSPADLVRDLTPGRDRPHRPRGRLPPLHVQRGGANGALAPADDGALGGLAPKRPDSGRVRRIRTTR